MKTETNRDKKGKRPFDSLSNAARGTGHVPKGRCPPIPDFVWSPPPHLLLVSRLRFALCLVLARLVQCTYETYISIKDLSCKRILSRTRCFAFNPILLSFFSLASYPLFVPLFNAPNFAMRFVHRNNVGDLLPDTLFDRRPNEHRYLRNRDRVSEIENRCLGTSFRILARFYRSSSYHPSS